MLTLKLSTSINIVKCLVCLHNFFMTKDGSEDTYRRFYSKDNKDEIENTECENNDDENVEEEDVSPRQVTKNKMRETLAIYFERN